MTLDSETVPLLLRTIKQVNPQILLIYLCAG